MARATRRHIKAASPSAGPPQAGLDPPGGSVAVLRDRGADIESRVLADHHQAIKLWLRMLACTTRVENVIRQRLRSEFGTTLPRFDLLAQLDREPEGLSMGELSARLMVTGGNVTGIVDQLEAEGLVVRAAHPTDRRAFQVRLTAAGRRQFRRMAAVHEAWIVELFDGWSTAQKTQVLGLLATLKQHLAALDAPQVPRTKRKESA